MKEEIAKEKHAKNNKKLISCELNASSKLMLLAW